MRPRAGTSGGDERALDILNLFIANIQTGFGPFISVYLTTQAWTQTDIGFALSLGTITAMASQLPAGILVDRVANKPRVAMLAIAAFTLSALLLAAAPTPLFVYCAEILHGFASCVLGPAIVAISLAIVGQVGLGQRFGRNARFSSIGNGVGAALMGACGYYVSERAVFLLTALVTLPALAVLWPLTAKPAIRQSKLRERPAIAVPGQIRDAFHILADRRLLAFAVAAMLFTLANAAMLPLVGSSLTKQMAGNASLLVAACIVVPQLVVAAISPATGGAMQRFGRKPLLMLGLATVALRATLFAITTDPVLVVAGQLLDGIAGATFGILVPLVTSDIAGRSRHFNLCLGFVGLAVGFGATISTTAAGAIADSFGDQAAFWAMAATSLAAILFTLVALPETRPSEGA